jgi:hypothetical protein
MPAAFHLAFWNVQNLYEPGVVARGPQDADEFDSKVQNLAQALNQFAGGSGADLLGFAEIQSEANLQQLEGKLSNGPFLRIWESATLASQTGLGLLAREAIFSGIQIVAVQRPTVLARPRVMIARCELHGIAEPFLLVLNHWKSRMPSSPMSDEDDRRETADWLGDLLARESKTSCVIVVGDFNAEPFETPFGELRLRGGRTFSSARWAGATPAYLYNAAWKFLSEPEDCQAALAPGYKESRPKSTHGEDSPSLFDHLLVSGAVLRDGLVTLVESEIQYPAIDLLTSRHKRGGKLIPSAWKYVAPGEFSGASDHLPLVAKFLVN